MKTNKEIKEYIEDIISDDENVVLFEKPDYATAFIGLTMDNEAVYDYDLMVEYLMVTDEMTLENAVEWIDFNTIRALPYIEKCPILLYSMNSEEHTCN